jgi:hypothetical protein
VVSLAETDFHQALVVPRLGESVAIAGSQSA